MTESIARVCARHPWTTITIWVALVVLAALFAARFLDGALTTDAYALAANVESEKADRLLEDRLRGPEPVTEFVIVQSDVWTVDDPAFQQEVETVFAEVTSLGDGVVATAQNYYQTADATLVSADRSTTIIPVVLTGELKEAEGSVGQLFEIVEDADRDQDFRVLLGGVASISHDTNELAERDLRQGESIGVPVALIILVLLFGTVVAALAPMVLAIVAIIIAIGVVAAIGQAFQLVFFVQMMITMIGLAVGIDYSLFVVSRFREELSRGLSPFDAVVRAGATAGRTVLFSGVTVVIALLGMLIVPASFFQSVATGAIVVVVVAMIATLTLLPAALTLMGSRVNRLPVPRIGRRASIKSPARDAEGFWGSMTRIATRFPIVSVLVVAVPMIVASAFYFQINTGLNGVDTFPEDARTREAFFVLEDKFSFGLLSPVEVVIEGDINDPGVQEGIDRLEAALVESPSFPFPPADLVVNPAGDLALLTVALHGEPRSHEAVAVVNELRNRIIPDAFAGAPAEVYVGGVTANSADLFDIVDRYTPIVFGLVLGLSFVILLMVFRSIVIAVKAVIMNLLSVGCTYGLLVLVFQKGVADALPFFRHAEVIDAWIPLFLFSILFGLSMDYHVFLLSRIRERYDQTGDNNHSVEYGLRSTAGLITGAALIMVVVFSGFASGKTINNQQVGFGLAVAIFLDATLVRSVLVPASMELLGRLNWYLPSFLSWLPTLKVEADEPQAAAAPSHGDDA